MSSNHQVPGGTVTLRSMRELSPRQRRRIRPYVLALAGPLDKIGVAGAVSVDGTLADTSSVLSGAELALTLGEAQLFTDMQDEITLALLAGWSFTAPLPTTIDGLLDVDDVTGQRGLYDTLSAAVAKVSAESMSTGFEVNQANLADDESPTGAFGG